MDAIAHLQSSIAKNPAYPDSRYELMRVYSDTSMNTEPDSLARETLGCDPIPQLLDAVKRHARQRGRTIT